MDVLIDEILSPNLAIRTNAVKQLISNQSIDLAPKLLEIVKEGPTYAKLDALKAYGNVITIDNVESLYGFLKSRDWHIRAETINCIYKLLGKESLEIITPFLKDKAYGVRSEVEKIIAEINC